MGRSSVWHSELRPNRLLRTPPGWRGSWIQWRFHKTPAQARALSEGTVPDALGLLPDGSQHFENSWGDLG